MAKTTRMTKRFTFLLFFVAVTSFSGYVTSRSTPDGDLVRTSCVHASYPSICLRTLSTYAGPAKTPRDLALAAVKVSIARAGKVSSYLTEQLSSDGEGSKRAKAALSDCIEQISESVDELKKTMSELQHLREGTFQWQMSNAETWVSAALTNEDTCLDGFQTVNGKVKNEVKSRISNVAKVTSNALYLINRLDATRRKSSVVDLDNERS